MKNQNFPVLTDSIPLGLPVVLSAFYRPKSRRCGGSSNTCYDDGMTILLTLWFACVGAAVGSFLNVVVYRLPLGKSVVSPPSHCPKCSHRIRWFDNMPVFGWLMLGGKCRDCKEPISVRYPLVEFFCGLVFGLLGFLTLERFPDGDVVNLLGLAGVESLLIVSLFAMGLIEFDGKPIPWRRTIGVVTLLLLGFFYGWFVLPIVVITLLILLVGRWILNRPIRCPFLVLAFVTFIVVCVAAITS